MGLLSRTSDDELVRRLRAGDERAFEAIHDRYRRPLIAHARRFLRRSDHDAEDVVQDVLLNAHRALRDDDRPVALKAYLYRLTRNRCIDEVRRARWGEAELPAERAGHDEDPAMIFHRKETLYRLVEDVADLPERQRIALLARELDGQSADEIAADLGMSTAATQMLIVRARDNLVKTRDARDADCLGIREQLLLADERGVRLSEHARRHVAGCDACAAYRRDLKRVAKRIRALAPPVGFLPILVAGKLAGGTGAKIAAVTAGAAVAVGAGVTLLDTTVLGEGERSPLPLLGAGGALPGVSSGGRIDRDSAVVFARVEFGAGRAAAGAERTVTVSCPAGMVAVGPARPDRSLPLRWSFAPAFSERPRTVTYTFSPAVLPAPLRTRIGLACRRPAANGSLLAQPRGTKPGETAARICKTAYFFTRPGREFRGSVIQGDPVSVVRTSASGKYVRIVTDAGTPGWIAADVLCGGAP